MVARMEFTPPLFNSPGSFCVSVIRCFVSVGISPLLDDPSNPSSKLDKVLGINDKMLAKLLTTPPITFPIPALNKPIERRKKG